MSFTQDNVKHLAHLASLAVYEDTNNTTQTKQLQSFESSIVKDLNNIINLIEHINELNTDDVTPMAHPLETTQRTRPDEVTEQDVREKMQAMVPTEFIEAGLYLVPKVIDN